MRLEDRQRFLDALKESDCVLIGAGNGLDMAEGLNIFRRDGHFDEAYGDLAAKTGVESVLQGLASSYGDPCDKWAFAVRFAQREWLDYEPSAIMRSIRSLVDGKDHFVLTYNFNGRFIRAGFDEADILETEGSVRRLICSRRCSGSLIPSEKAVRESISAMEEGLFDESMIPRCGRCGAPLELSVREDRLYEADDECVTQMERFNEFVERAAGRRLLVLEFGVGARNRSIKGPLLSIMHAYPCATYVTFNYDEIVIPDSLADRSIGIPGDLGHALSQIVSERRGSSWRF